jgi:hypothetical protein
MAFALFKAIKAWVQAPKVIKVVKRRIGCKNLHNKEIKKENGPNVKRNRFSVFPAELSGLVTACEECRRRRSSLTLEA